MIFNFNCKLKNHIFKYKIEADNISQAKIKVREHIKNSVEIEEVIKEPIVDKSDFFDLLNNIVNNKE